jgi:hypothetical protein
VTDDQGSVPKHNDTGETNVKADRSMGVIVAVCFYLAVAVFIYWISQTVQKFVWDHKWPLGIISVAFIIIVIALWVRHDILGASARRKIGWVIFCVIPFSLALLGAISLLRAPHQVILLRSVFLAIVSLLPAMLYYLFIVSRKPSLLYEYWANLHRLGLLEAQRLGFGPNAGAHESELDRRLRVASYIQKFEAVYGSVSEPLRNALLSPNGRGGSSSIPPSPDDSEGPSPAQRPAVTVFTSETAIPVVLATLLIGLGWFLTLAPWEMVRISDEDTSLLSHLRLVLQPKGIIVCFAFLGSYFFSLQMLFRRYVRKDLRATAYIAVSLRIILAVLGTWAVVQAANVLKIPNLSQDGGEYQGLLVVGFVIGAFPPVAWQVIQSAFRKVTGAKYFVPSLSSEMPVSELDGLTVWHEARLEEEDIENIPNMATADIVELMLNTRTPPERIVDWVDQAILYTQLGPEKKSRQRLREHGIRTASDLVVAYAKSQKRGSADLEAFEKIVPSDGRARIRAMVDTLSNYPNLQIVQKWRREGEYCLTPAARTLDGATGEENLGDASPGELDGKRV